MRIKKWEKWYWRIVFVMWIGLIIWIITWDRGFVFTKENGEAKEISKLHSALIVFLQAFILPLWIWFVLRFWFLKTNDFIRKFCRKEYSGSFGTEKNVCKTCYEKRRIKEKL